MASENTFESLKTFSKNFYNDPAFKQPAETGYNTVDLLDTTEKLCGLEDCADKVLLKCDQDISGKNIGGLLQETKFVKALEQVAPLTALLLTDIIDECRQALKPALYTMTFCPECENYMAEAMHPAGTGCPDCKGILRHTDATIKV